MRRPQSALTTRVTTGFVALATALALGWAPTQAAAQATGTLTGTVRDAGSQRPLEAAQVFIEGTGIGALTNAAGRFLLLNVPAGEVTLQAELVGYRAGSQQVTVTAGQSTAADFGLQQTAITLNEIVVTGAGVAQERRKLGNTLASIDASRLENAPIQDFSQMLAGREPGVQILPTSGMTGEGARIRIRGSASLSQSNEPIIYIDGVRMDKQGVNTRSGGAGRPSRLDDIPPESIERIEILKGAAAATLYGTEASNGVIQVFTKKGRTGAPNFTAQFEAGGISVPTDRMLPLADFARDATQAARMQARLGKSAQPFEVMKLDALPELLGPGHFENISLSATGGSDNFQYFVSGRFSNEDGPIRSGFFDFPDGLTPEDDEATRIQTTASFTVIPSSKVRINGNILFSDLDLSVIDNANNIFGVFSSLLMGQLRLATADNLFGAPAFGTTREFALQQNGLESNHFNGSVNVGFTPWESFRLDGTFGFDFTSDTNKGQEPFGQSVDNFRTSNTRGFRRRFDSRSKELTTDIKGSWVYTLPILDNRIENTLLFGQQGFVTQRETTGGSGNTFAGPGLESLEALTNESSFENFTRITQVGGYLQDQIAWDDWVFVTLGGRWDTNSAFGNVGSSTEFYPKASLSMVPSQAYPGIFTNDVVSTVRVRAAIGKSGLQPAAFDQLTTFSPINAAGGSGFEPNNLGNPTLSPEVSTEWEVGLELGLFDDRASIDFTYWDRKVNDALVDQQFPVSGGFTDEQIVNIGRLDASGVEVNIRGTAYQSNNVSVNLFANGAYTKEAVSDLGGAPSLKTGGSYPRYRNFITQGFEPGAFFGAQVADLDIPLNLDGSCVEPTRQQALDFFSQPRDPSSFKPLAIGNNPNNNLLGDADGTLASNNCGGGLLETFLGKPNPDWQGSFGANISLLGNFELNNLFEYKLGDFYVQDLSGMFRRANSVIGRNTPDAARLNAIMQNPASTPEQRLDAAVEWANTIEGLSPFSGTNGIFNAGFVRWRELSLSYRAPSDLVSRFGLSTVTVNAGVRNLKLWVNGDYTGMDPEGNVIGRCTEGLNCQFLSSTEGWGIPIARRFSLSTRVTF